MEKICKNCKSALKLDAKFEKDFVELKGIMSLAITNAEKKKKIEDGKLSHILDIKDAKDISDASRLSILIKCTCPAQILDVSSIEHKTFMGLIYKYYFGCSHFEEK